MSDLFQEDVPDEWIIRIFQLMYRAEDHVFQVLTKRAHRMHNLLAGHPYLGNVWLGVSAENQQYADERIPLLLQTPAAVRFVSAEPLLGPIDLTYLNLLPPRHRVDGFPWLNGLTGVVAGPDDLLPHLDWVIVGGESGGPRERRLDPARANETWVLSLRDQCTAAGVAFFFKQWGGPTPKAGGRLLDGREWSEFPALA
jgi:protein gp37